MDPNPSWRQWISLVPAGTQTTSGLDLAPPPDVHAGLKRRRIQDDDSSETKKARRKLTEENASESLLLLLPPEVRRLIFEHVLGGLHIHVEQLHVGNTDRYEKKDIPFGRGLWNEICLEPEAEAVAYTTFVHAEMGENEKATPFGKTEAGEDIGGGYHTASWTERHKDCSREPSLQHFNVDLDRWMSRQFLSLRCLRTCRLIYKEMRMIPYTSNTFLFRSPMAFQAFASSCRPEQFRSIHHISMPIAIGSAPFSEARSKLWASIIWQYNLACRLRSLKLLDITIELYFPRDSFNDRPHNKKPTADDCIDEIRLSGLENANESTDWVDQLASLSRNIPRFRLAVADDPLSMWGTTGRTIYSRDRHIRDPQNWMNERNEHCLTVEQKQALAVELETRLILVRKEEKE